MRGYHCQTKADVTVSVSICDGHTRLENCTTLTLQSFFRQASNSPASFHAPSGVQGATRPTRSSGGVMGAKVGWAWDLRISALQCSNIPAFSLRAQVGRGIVAAPWLSTFVMSECACNWPQPSMSTGTRTTTFGWQPVCSAPGKWSNSSSVPENVIASPSVSKALLPALHIHLSSVQTKKVRG